MNKLNLPPFYVGQKVVYITGINMPKDSIHTVTGIIKKSCGCYGLYINTLNLPWKDNLPIHRCAECHSTAIKDHPIIGDWCSKSFRAIEEAKPPLMTFTQIKETEKEEILTLN